MANGIQKDLGKVTAYSYAKAAGYTGTEEQFQTIFNEFTENAPGLIDRMDTAVARAEAAVTNIDATVQDAVDDAVEEATASAVATANQAVTDAQAAQTAAEGAVTQANAAVTQANAAVTAAQAAQSAAEDAAESFVLDRTLTDPGAAAPADLVGNLKESIGYYKPSFTIVEGYYINNSSVKKPGSNFNMSAPIYIPAKSMIVFTAAGYNQSVAMIATCNENGENLKAVAVSIDSTKRTYTYYAEFKTYIILSYLKAQGYEYTLLDVQSNAALNHRLTPIENYVVNGSSPSYTTVVGDYIGSDGLEQSNVNFSKSSVIQIEARSLITFKGTGYNQNVAMIATCDQNGTTFVPVAISIDSSEHTYTYFAEQDCYIVVSWKTSNAHELHVNGSTANVSLLANINNVASYFPLSGKNILSAFTNITCIGDSLTYSAVYTGASNYRQAFKPYPAILGVKTGATMANISSPGASAKSWWNRHNEQISEKTNQLAIVYLGTNEGLTDTIDTDCSGSDHTQWADTNTGCYGKIIAKFLENNSRVILVKCYRSSGNIETTNSVIEQMAEKFNAAIIDNQYLSDKKYHYFPDGNGINTVHYNDFGYAVFVDQLIYNISNLPEDMMKRIIPA